MNVLKLEQVSGEIVAGVIVTVWVWSWWFFLGVGRGGGAGILKQTSHTNLYPSSEVKQ